MKKLIVMALVTALLPMAGCVSTRWDTRPFDQFPLNGAREKRGDNLIRVIALVPGGGDLSEAIGIELAKRGFVVVPAPSTIRLAADVDFTAITRSALSASRNPGEMGKLRQALLGQGIHAFVIVRIHDFAPRPYLGHKFWQQADLEVYSTTEENPLSNGAIAGTGFVNPRADRASSPTEAAVEMVGRLAMGPGGI